MNGSVQFHLQITDPTGQCVLWDETQTQNVSNGAFSLLIGQGTVNFNGGSSTLVDGVFANSVAINCKGGQPTATVTPSTSAGRNLNVTFNDGSGAGTQSLAQQISIDSG